MALSVNVGLTTTPVICFFHKNHTAVQLRHMQLFDPPALAATAPRGYIRMGRRRPRRRRRPPGLTETGLTQKHESPPGCLPGDSRAVRYDTWPACLDVVAPP